METHRNRGFVLSVLLCFLALLSRGGASRAAEWIKFDPDGSFTVTSPYFGGSIKGAVHHFGKDWGLQIQNDESMKDAAGKDGSVSGTFIVKDGSAFALSQTAEKVSGHEIRYACAVEAQTPVATRQLCLDLNLPIGRFAGKTLLMDDKEVALPTEFGETSLFGTRPVKKIVIPIPDGRLEIVGNLNVMMQDDRRFKGDTFSLRLNFAPSSGDILKSSLEAAFVFRPFDAAPISLRNVVNMGFRDEVADDGKGGWSDQGPDNDLRMMKPGLRSFGGIPFDVIDPAKNGGKACITMAGPGGNAFPERVTVAGNGASYRYLYFLHTAAWAKSAEAYGNVYVKYADGTETAFDVVGKRDLADWWGPSPTSNGAVAWTGENNTTYVGLYLSRFPIEPKPIQAVELASTRRGVWMIVGLSGSNDDVPLPKDMGEYYIVADKDWQALPHSLDVEKGSALDLSFLCDAPAGKHGRVIIQNGRFAFESAPGKPVRFYGSNLCFTANYLEKSECEALADRMARYGYNSVRFHHHDGGMIVKDAADSLTIDPAQMDKLDYLFHCLKQRGIYITTDIFISRWLKAAEIQVFDKDSRSVKALVPVSEAVANNLKAFAKLWLEHVNPYTGLAWKDDPALMTVSFVNENTLYGNWANDPITKKLYEDEFHAWVEKEKIPCSTDEERGRALTQFTTNMQIRSYEIMKEYVGGVLGCKALYSDCNMSAYVCQSVARDRFDYVDNHGYWDHPRFPVKSWSLPYGFHNLSILRRYCGLPVSSMATRIFGKPFTYTEFNYVFPNDYRGEGNPVMGAYSALQGWDAIYRFAYAHKRENATTVRPAEGFDVATDPLSLLGERIVSLLFLRGDVSEAKTSVPFVMTPDVAQAAGGSTGAGRGFTSDYSRIGLVHKVGGVVLRDGTKLPDGAPFAVGVEPLTAKQTDGKPFYEDRDGLLDQLAKEDKLRREAIDLETGVVKSDTGEITLLAKEDRLSVVTPRSECQVLPAKGTAEGNRLAVREVTTFSTVFAGALDDRELGQSKRILVLHLTDVKNSKTKFLDPRHTTLAKNGELPHLVRKGTAKVEIKLEGGSAPEVYALDMTGKRMGKMASSFENGTVKFTADTAGPMGSVLAYEVVR